VSGQTPGAASATTSARDALAVRPASGTDSLVTAGLLVALLGAAYGFLRHVHSTDPGLARGADASLVWIALGVWCVALWIMLGRLADWRVGARPGAAPRGWLDRIAPWTAPALLGAALIFLWEVLVIGWQVPKVLLPAPHAVAEALVRRFPVLWGDFVQTGTGVLAGFVIGSGLGLLVALAADRIDYLKRGLLPLCNLAGAVPIIGIAPIMVMWFGFGWESKAAVAAIVCFFPMLVNTLAGLAHVDPMHRDLMRTYAASPSTTLAKLRLPGALPFLFNALKINSTLALIAGIVAEFFGSPIVGLGFRISAEVARMNVDVVWAAITLAALAGSLFYGLIALAERVFTFWHPSFRR
jgi:NitT/TauT family transport system permease protein